MGACYKPWLRKPSAGRTRVRPNGRPEYLEDTRPSWVYNGGACVPGLMTGEPYPTDLTSFQFHLRHCALLEARLRDLYADPVFCRVAGRVLTSVESDRRRSRLLTVLLGPLMWTDSGRTYPLAEPAREFHLKAVSLLLDRLISHFSTPVYCHEVGRLLTTGERIEWGEWHLRNLLPEAYDEGGRFRWVRFSQLERSDIPTDWLP